MLGKLINLLAIIGIASCMKITTAPCDEGKSSAGNVTITIEPCTKEPCVLSEGNPYALSVHFVPTTAIKTLKVAVRAEVLGIWVPYSIDKPDACKDSHLTCPIAVGADSLYEYSLKLPTLYPAISLVLEWKMTDDTGATPVCEQFPLTVTKPTTYQVVP